MKKWKPKKQAGKKKVMKIQKYFQEEEKYSKNNNNSCLQRNWILTSIHP